ncbi:hypothetical protein MNEG_15702 [Monoraphidium neglectum]|uniref:S1 motif domain-containing protein n=1 Tax=Monoraphidium neglectum TaxID=145388 RepID=A0A0D2LQQ3_9CHLO|nr:hypothetical protein MNEG_15702 [Monoraphidium neglectum]KIY92261.1 hypothetical protein MNEG_15702 [Monoraphidium neglectum]|eukprot:XP_013891281.1 hypothetical protein MNEG_15702 [Monoraphidium neglectum]
MNQVAEDIRFSREDADEDKVKALEFLFPRGSPAFVKILSAEPDGSGGFKVNGSMRAVDQESGADLDPTGQLAAAGRGGGGPGGGGPGGGSDEPPEEGSIHRGVVRRIEAYGIFVALEGFRKHGLVHSSQVSGYLDLSTEEGDEAKKKALAEVVAVGEPVWVKVVEVTDDDSGRGPRIGCSIKLVNQADGTDLDPGGTRYRPRRDASGGGGGGRGGAIGADAGAVRGGAVDWGYIKADTKEYGKGGYEILEDEPPPGPGPGPAAGAAAAFAGGGGGAGARNGCEGGRV